MDAIKPTSRGTRPDAYYLLKTMATRFPIKMTRIGNSRGVRIPSAVISQLGLDRAGLTAEIRADGLLLTAPQKNYLGLRQPRRWLTPKKTGLT